MKALTFQDTEPAHEEKLPEPGVYVWVQCDYYRTLAERDEEGKWWTVAKHEPLPSSIKILGMA